MSISELLVTVGIGALLFSGTLWESIGQGVAEHFTKKTKRNRV
jgi:hypothetical protein